MDYANKVKSHLSSIALKHGARTTFRHGWKITSYSRTQKSANKEDDNIDTEATPVMKRMLFDADSERRLLFKQAEDGRLTPIPQDGVTRAMIKRYYRTLDVIREAENATMPNRDISVADYINGKVREGFKPRRIPDGYILEYGDAVISVKEQHARNYINYLFELGEFSSATTKALNDTRLVVLKHLRNVRRARSQRGK